MPSSRAVVVLACVVCLLGGGGVRPPAAAGRTHAENILVLGRVSNNPRKDYPCLKALAGYLAAELRGVGVEAAAVQLAEDSERMSALLRDGAVDLAFDTASPAIRYETEAGAELLLREWRDGAADYRSVLFKRRDDPLGSLRDLLGRKIAFERRGSTSAHLVPLAELEAAGLRARELASPDQEPAPASLVVCGERHQLEDAVGQAPLDAVLEEPLPRVSANHVLGARTGHHPLGLDAHQPQAALGARRRDADQGVELAGDAAEAIDRVGVAGIAVAGAGHFAGIVVAER